MTPPGSYGVGCEFHLKLSVGLRPIAIKYHERNVTRTLDRELNVPASAETEANGTSVTCAWLRACFLCAYVCMCVYVHLLDIVYAT